MADEIARANEVRESDAGTGGAGLNRRPHAAGRRARAERDGGGKLSGRSDRAALRFRSGRHPRPARQAGGVCLPLRPPLGDGLACRPGCTVIPTNRILPAASSPGRPPGSPPRPEHAARRAMVFRPPAAVQPEPLLGMLANPAFDYAGDDLHGAGDVDLAFRIARLARSRRSIRRESGDRAAGQCERRGSGIRNGGPAAPAADWPWCAGRRKSLRRRARNIGRPACRHGRRERARRRASSVRKSPVEISSPMMAPRVLVIQSSMRAMLGRR